MGAAPDRPRPGPAGCCAHAPSGGVGAVVARPAQDRHHATPQVPSAQAIGPAVGFGIFGGAMSPARFGTPVALFLLALLPVVASLARRRVTPRGALALRLVVCTLVVTALASPSLLARGGDLSVVFAIDRSDSISAEQTQARSEERRVG